MAKMTSTGVELAVVAETPATFDGAGYALLTFVNVGEVIDLPEYGPTVQVVESNPLATGITEKFKGFINFGSTSMGLEIDFDDAGQEILEEAVVGTTKNVRHSFRVTYPDGTIEYYSGKVFSYTRNPGSANSMVGSTAQVEIETPIVRVAPSV